jgi:8-oxo-dGTP pyrophosphatase MutT (NUDIX family)
MPVSNASGRDPELTTSRRFADAQRPRDSATLIVVRHDDNVPRVLLGQRHDSHAFMPNMFVFPGGRLDPADLRTKVAVDLHPLVHEKLMQRMRGRTSPSRARGLAVAAIRETYEETGLFLGKIPEDARLETEDWDTIISAAELDLSSLRFFARAITPPGRTRRFDSRFFATSAVHIGNLDNPRHPGSGELLTPHWFSFADALELELPTITRDVLKRLQPLMEMERDLPVDQPVCFRYLKGKSWHEDTL